MSDHENLSPDERERRRFARISNNFFIRSCRISEITSEAEEKTAGIVRDINLVGLAFLTEKDYCEGETLELEVEFVGIKFADAEQNGLLRSAAILIRGSVARTELLEPGLLLTVVLYENLEEEDSALIRKAVSYQRQLDEAG